MLRLVGFAIEHSISVQVGHNEESIHFSLLPTPHPDMIDMVVERRVAAMRVVIDLGRVIRERKNISLRVSGLSLPLVRNRLKCSVFSTR